MNNNSMSKSNPRRNKKKNKDPIANQCINYTIRNTNFPSFQVHGKKGLVPASFIEEVAILKSKGRRVSIK